MAYKEVSTNTAIARIDARLARIEAALVALTGTGAPVAPVASATATPATEAVAKARVLCTLHPEHKPFTLTPAGAATGSGFHFAWCKGAAVEA